MVLAEGARRKNYALTGVSAVKTYDERDRVAVSGGSSRFFLIVLVVHESELLPFGVDDPPLVGIGSARVGRARNDRRCFAGFSVLVGSIIDGQRVFVVAVADVTTVVFLVRAAVNDTLRVVDVSILGSTSRAEGFGNVVEVDVDQSGCAGGVARLRANGNRVSFFFVLRGLLER